MIYKNTNFSYPFFNDIKCLFKKYIMKYEGKFVLQQDTNGTKQNLG